MSVCMVEFAARVEANESFLKQIDLSPEFEESTRNAGLTAKVGGANYRQQIPAWHSVV